MTAIDRQKLIEDVAKAEWAAVWPRIPYEAGLGAFAEGAAAAIPVIVAAVLEPIRTNTETAAIGCRARGDSEGERRWLDLTILLDRIEADCRGGE